MILSREQQTVRSNEQDVKVMGLGKKLEGEQIAQLLLDNLNSFRDPFMSGWGVGKALQGAHCTLQRAVVGWLLGVLTGLSEVQYTDGRNETAIATARKIAKMFRNDELPLGTYR